MTTVEINDARNRFDELLHRSKAGECFLVVEGDKPVVEMKPVAAIPGRPPGWDYLAESHAFLATQKLDPTPIKDDIEFGRL